MAKKFILEDLDNECDTILFVAFSFFIDLIYVMIYLCNGETGNSIFWQWQ